MIEVDPVTFPKRVRPLPTGYRVVQLDSGHFMWVGPFDPKTGCESESSINVDRWAVWRGAFAHAREAGGSADGHARQGDGRRYP